MKFLAMHVNGFVLFAEPFSIPLDRGLVFIEGVNLDFGDSTDSNGAGKSLILEAFDWGIGGKMVRYGDKRLGAEDVCNAITGTADVAIDFTPDDGPTILRARRHRKRTGSTKLDVLILQNGEWKPLAGIAADVARATGDLTTLLGFDYDTLRFALWLQGTGLTLAQSGYSGQMAALESALRFDMFTMAGDAANEDKKALAIEDSIARGEISRWAQMVHASRHAIESMESLDETEAETELRAEIVDLEKLAAVWPEVQSERAEINKKWIEANAETARVQERYQAATDALLALNVFAPDGIVAAECPTCLQPVSGEVLTGLIEAAQTRQSDIAQTLSIAEGESQETAELAADVQERYSLVERVTRSLPEKRAALAAIQQRRERRLTVIQQEQVTLDDASQKEATATESVNELAHRIARATFWVKGYGGDGLKGEVLAAAAPVLNEAALRYSDLLTDGQIRVEINPIRASRTEDIMTISGAGAPTYKGCSNGERRKIDLMLALSLRACARWRLGQQINIAAWDEVFDPLDESSIRRALMILQQDQDEMDCIFVVTHSPHVKAMLPGAKVLRVTRQGGQSRVEWR